MVAVDVVTTIGAFVVIVVGVAMLHLFKELQVGSLSLVHSLGRSHRGFSSLCGTSGGSGFVLVNQIGGGGKPAGMASQAENTSANFQMEPYLSTKISKPTR